MAEDDKNYRDILKQLEELNRKDYVESADMRRLEAEIKNLKEEKDKYFLTKHNFLLWVISGGATILFLAVAITTLVTQLIK